MSKSKSHSNFNVFMLLPVALIGLYMLIRQDLEHLSLFAVCFLYATYFSNPDVDIANQIKLFSFKGLMTLPFRIFYAPFFKHRSSVSHSVLWGTPSRLLCMGVFVIVASFCFSFIYKLYSSYVSAEDVLSIGQATLNSATYTAALLYRLVSQNEALFGFAVAGFFIADLGHLIMDKVFH
ncbi:DUF2227 family putative metal-binding protein [Oligoflexia bacterium]|nr:DUF2227 family putative metal-binding protein [Oligoflexia bacterium]